MKSYDRWKLFCGVAVGLSVAGGCGSGGASRTDAGTTSGSHDGSAPDRAAAEIDGATGDGASAPDLAPDGPQGNQLYVSPGGLDTNLGTMAAPLKTIAKAAMEAKPGDVIWLLDGTYDKTTEPRIDGANAGPCGAISGVVIPAGVTLAAVNPGAVKIEVAGVHGLCLQGATVRNIDFAHPPSGGVMIDVLEGTNVIEGASFADAYCGGGGGWEAAVMARGMATLTFIPGRTANFMGAGGCAFLTVWDDAQVAVNGGSISGGMEGSTSGNALIIVRDRGKLTLKGTLLETTNHNLGVTLAHTATLALETGTILRGFKIAGILPRASGVGATITMQGATIERCANGILQEYGYASIATATIVDSQFSNNTAGIQGGPGTVLTLDVRNSRFVGNGSGITGSIGNATISGSTFTGNTTVGISLQTGAACAAKIRNTTVIGVGAGNDRGVDFSCQGSTLDLGSLAEPGGNTFTGSTPGLTVTGTGNTVDAIGNTWRSLEQGSTAEGKYEAQGVGTVLQVTGGAGLNYRVGTNQLLLAQNP